MSTKASTIQRAALAVAKAALTGSGQQSNGSQQSAPSPDRKAGLSTGKAILMGAGLMVAGQALVRTRGQAALDAVRHGLAQKLEAGLHGSDDSEDADFEDNEYEDDEYDDEPEAEADEDFEDEDFEDEPEAEEDEDFEDEPEAEEDEDFEDDGEVEQPPRRSRREKAGSGSRRK